MADFRYGFFYRPDNKKIESHPEKIKKTSHVPDHKSKLTRADAEERRQPIAVLPGTKFVPTTETYTEKFHLSSRDVSQPSHAKHYDLNKLIAKVPREEGQQKHHDMIISKPLSDINKAIEFLKEVVNLQSSKNPCPTLDHHKEDDCMKTIDSNEAARRYGNCGAPSPVLGADVATINCKEAARKYKGATV